MAQIMGRVAMAQIMGRVAMLQIMAGIINACLFCILCYYLLFFTRRRKSTPVLSSLPSFVLRLKKLDDMVYEVYNPTQVEAPEVEIVFFHGLQLKHDDETYFRTWMTRDDSQLWLRTWLVEAFPAARILIVSYDSSARKTSTQGRMDMHVIGENLLSSLTSDSVNVGQSRCPVVLVGHCLGGLVMKELCLRAEGMMGRMNPAVAEMERVSNFLTSLQGMFFYGTPHSGTAIFDLMQKQVRSEGPLLQETETLKAPCARRNEEFQQLRLRHGWLIRGMGESMETFVECIGKSVHVVPEASARLFLDLYCTTEADHYDICKPKQPVSNSFQFLADFLRQIRADDLRAKDVTSLDTGEYVVDMVGRASHVCQLLKHSHKVFLVGVSGIGKTTLANQVCNLMSRNFKATIFIQLSDLDNGDQLRRKLREKLEEQDMRLRSKPWREIAYLKERKVLIVVDNMTTENQLKVFNGWPGNGRGVESRLLVATTNLLLSSSSRFHEIQDCTYETTMPWSGPYTRSHEITPVSTDPPTSEVAYQVPYLSDKESEKLLVYYAFNGLSIPQPVYSRWTLCLRGILQQCDRFPLPLKIVGSYIHRQLLQGFEEVEFWELTHSILIRLTEAEEVVASVNSDDDIWAKLGVLYRMQGKDEQDLLLDAATLFYGLPFSLVKIIWRVSRRTADLAWANLKNAFLADLDSEGRVWMHKQLRDLCCSRACPRDISVHRYSRIFQQHDAIKLITDAKPENLITEGLRLHARICLPKGFSFCGFSCLKFLILKGVDVEGSSEKLELPSSIVYLSWSESSFETVPVDFNSLPELVALELRDCRAMRFLTLGSFHPPFRPTQLKWLELEGCRLLERLPDELVDIKLEYLGLKNTGLELGKVIHRWDGLRRLQASGTLLTIVPEFRMRTSTLMSIDLSRTRITELPDSVGSLTCLGSLMLDGAPLTSLPESIGELRELKALHLQDTKVSNLPKSFGKLRKLEHLVLKNTPLEELPESVVDLRSLKYLQLLGTNIRKLPDQFGDLEKLEYLILTRTGVTELPESFTNLSRLKVFGIARPQSNRRPGERLGSLQLLSSLQNLERVALSTEHLGLKNQIPECAQLQPPGPLLSSQSGSSLTLSNTTEVSPLQVDFGKTWDSGEQGPNREGSDKEGVGDFALQHSTVGMTSEHILSLLPRLSTVTHVWLVDNRNLVSVPASLFHALKQMPSLAVLYLINFNDTVTLPDELGSLTKLKQLHLVDCKKLEELPETLGRLSSLVALEIRNLSSFRKLPESLAALPSLLALQVVQCSRLLNLPSSLGHPSEASSSSQYASSDYDYPPSGSQELFVYTDSWNVLHCGLECGLESVKNVLYSVGCREMNELHANWVNSSLYYQIYSRACMDKLRQMYEQRHRHDDLPLDLIHRASSRPDARDVSKRRYMRLRVNIECWGEGPSWTSDIYCTIHPNICLGE